MQTTADILSEIKSIQAAFLTLKDEAKKGIDILIDFVNSDKEIIDIQNDDKIAMTSVIMLDCLLKDETNYSVLDDFNFTKNNLVVKKFDNKDKCIENIKFLEKFLNYRSEIPIDLGTC